jgi:hypothetical protein
VVTKPHQPFRIVDKRRFVLAAMHALAGEAHISFEGRLGSSKLAELRTASTLESTVLRRNTIQPKQDFLLLPLEAEGVEAIGRALGGTVPLSILHIQVEKQGELALGLYDLPKPHIFIGKVLPPQFMSKLQSEGVVKENRSKPIN